MVLYIVCKQTADVLDRYTTVAHLAENHGIPLDNVKAIARELRDMGLVETRGEASSDKYRMRVLPSGIAHVERASLDSDPDVVNAPPGVLQTEYEVRRVLCTLAEYGVEEGDPEQGQHMVSAVSLQGMTNLVTPRLNRAKELLKDRGWIAVFPGMDPSQLGWQAQLMAEGYREYEQAQSPLAPEPRDPPGGAQLWPSTIIGDVYNFRDVIAPSQIGGHGNTQHVTLSSLDHQAVQQLVDALRELLPQLPLAEDDRAEIDADIATITSQLASPRPKPAIIRGALESVQPILLGVAGNIVYAAGPDIDHKLTMVIQGIRAFLGG